jgi:cytochrome d ubiquinol oxidase subunit II
MLELESLAMIFAGLMALAILVYAILDGYDLGVGILLPSGSDEATCQQRDTMIASIGPFWDANETWLVLAIGLLLIAFPQAYNLVLENLYMPATIMLLGLIIRGVAFDFRAKVALDHKTTWDRLFQAGSLITALSQGYMLGLYVMGLQTTPASIGFALLSACGVAAAYSYIGAGWLVMKTEGELQQRAARWARRSGWMCFAGVLGVCLVNPWVNPVVFDRWFSFPYGLLLLYIPVVSLALFAINDRVLVRIPFEQDFGCWIPFVASASIFFVCFQGLAYSFYPYIIPGQLTMIEAASAAESLRFMLVGALIVVPIILAYTVFSYRVFWGKATQLKYY